MSEHKEPKIKLKYRRKKYTLQKINKDPFSIKTIPECINSFHFQQCEYQTFAEKVIVDYFNNNDNKFFSLF